ncbi:glycosyltransferase [Homoserinibacter sp. YIM 151385]|uniref:glycosyltransferase n=1 Tax=Homoserinibacter sp. YIM 151385 TaxID=2985506 RepID=UPI0022F04FBC|nr:glycosyltransferase [Homoserinibacter sp. YIM 151385]WBU38445.1 glycosyltransferase [Homoserinibacter sp. YIM 151385]
MTDGSTPASRPLRILIGCDTFPPDMNGAAVFTARLAAGLVERGHEVHVLAPGAADGFVGARVEEHQGEPMTVHRLYSWKWLFHEWLRFALPWRIKANAARVIDEVKPDAVHFQSHIVTGIGLAWGARRRGIRLVGTNHTMPENIVQHVQIMPKPMLRGLIRIQWRAAERVFRQADAVTTPTRRAADYFEKNTGLRGVRAISCGIDMRNYTPDLTPRSANRIVFVGRLDEEKHLDDLVRAIALLDPELDAQVTLIGDGDQRHKIAALAKQLGVEDRVRLAGKVSDEELRATLTAATVFAMPSRAELQSIATMEAMASGLPVVAADAMALPHLVHDGENGYLFQPGDIEGFAARLTQVMRAAPEERERMQRASLELVTAHDINRTLDTFEALYRGDTPPGE